MTKQHFSSRGQNARGGDFKTTYTIAVRHIWVSAGYDLPAAQGDWVDSAVCAQTDPNLFYPEGKGFTGAKAKEVCRTCPVRIQCLDWALEHDERYGVWGGMTADQRAQLKKGRP
jgi:WhiB family redox-sensing transcriptional regulator